MKCKMVVSAILVLMVPVAALAADITGTWTAAFDTQVGVQNYTYTFKVDGSKLTGRVKSQFSDGEILEGTINGDDISFVENLTYEGMPLRIVYKGRISGDEIRLSRNVADIATEEAVAKRVEVGIVDPADADRIPVRPSAAQLGQDDREGGHVQAHLYAGLEEVLLDDLRLPDADVELAGCPDGKGQLPAVLLPYPIDQLPPIGIQDCGGRGRIVVDGIPGLLRPGREVTSGLIGDG